MVVECYLSDLKSSSIFPPSDCQGLMLSRSLRAPHRYDRGPGERSRSFETCQLKNAACKLAKSKKPSPGNEKGVKRE